MGRNLIFGLIGAILAVSCVKKTESTATTVVLKQNEKGQHRLFVNGKEFFVKGAGLEFGDISLLAAHGGNSFRTWRTENGEKSAKEVLDEAHENGLMVLMGLDIGRERHGFDYDDPVWVKEQFEYIKGEVLKYKDHPALLAWGIGNELNHEAENMKVWNAVNDISKMIHKVDPNHPTTTMLAGINKKVTDYMKVHCNDLDFLSVQMYGDIVNLQQRIKDAGYEGPYMVTEWGATGHWEVPRTEWDVAIEQTSQQKAETFIERYNKAILADPVNCLGSYAFLWGQKQERTPTWYGMFLENGNRTETVDAMHYLWNNEWPANRAPTIDSLRLDGQHAYQDIRLAAGDKYRAQAWGRCFENEELTYSWEIMPESTDLKQGGDHENRPQTLMEFENNPVNFKAPTLPGAYRLFVYITDPAGNAATGNIPFLVE
jgi:hypothetical protein